MKNQFFQANTTLFCDSLDQLIISFTTVIGSHKCLAYHALHCCAKEAQFFCKKWNIVIFVCWGRFCHPIWGRLCHLFCPWLLILSLINKHCRWLWCGANWRSGFTQNASAMKVPKNISQCTDNSENLLLEPYMAVILYIVVVDDDDDEWNVLPILQGLYGWHPVILTSAPPFTECALCDRTGPMRDRFYQTRYQHIIDASVEITELQLKQSIHHLKLLPHTTNQ